MKIVCLVENTEGTAGCGTEHGLSLYVETDRHRLLMDTGASDLLLRNAEKKNIDLRQVDTVILSHGHSDHGGGIASFAGINPTAKIYMQASAEGAYYAHHQIEQEPNYIGLAPEIRELPQIVRIQGDAVIDEELSLFSGVVDERPVPASNRPLKEKLDGDYIQDAFRHEQYLVIRQGEKRVLFSGCGHHGIRNILSRYRKLFGTEPDAVISGFHLLQRNGYTEEDFREITDTAHELAGYRTVFYTGHCTGDRPFEMMKQILGDQINYLHCGDELEL